MLERLAEVLELERLIDVVQFDVAIQGVVLANGQIYRALSTGVGGEDESGLLSRYPNTTISNTANSTTLSTTESRVIELTFDISGHTIPITQPVLDGLLRMREYLRSRPPRERFQGISTTLQNLLFTFKALEGGEPSGSEDLTCEEAARVLERFKEVLGYERAVNAVHFEVIIEGRKLAAGTLKKRPGVWAMTGAQNLNARAVVDDLGHPFSQFRNTTINTINATDSTAPNERALHVGVRLDGQRVSAVEPYIAFLEDQRRSLNRKSSQNVFSGFLWNLSSIYVTFQPATRPHGVSGRLERLTCLEAIRVLENIEEQLRLEQVIGVLKFEVRTGNVLMGMGCMGRLEPWATSVV